LPPVTRPHFDVQSGKYATLLIGSTEEVVEKIIRYSKALGGISRLSFQSYNDGLSHEKLMFAIGLIGAKIMPLVNR